MSRQYIVLFDGVCNLCNSSVNFVIDRDPKHKFRFAALQSIEGEELLKNLGLSTTQFDSIVLLDGKNVYTQSSAALRIAKELSGAWPILYIFMIIPSFIRDWVYDVIAKNRYKWFGKKNACRIPTPELKERFL